MGLKKWAALTGTAVISASAVLAVQWIAPDLPVPFGAGSRPAQATGSLAGQDGPRLSSQERVRLQRALNDVVGEGSIGTVAELAWHAPKGSDTWNGAAGTADRESGAPVDPGAHFRIASLSKPFVAAVVLQLAEEQHLDLGDTIADHISVPLQHAERITLRMLLSHTSGVHSYSRSMPDVREEPERLWTPGELVAIAAEHGPEFSPGAETAYSNTNYVLLAMIIEEVTGRPYVQEITDRILRPLDLTDTYLPEGPAVPEPFLAAYLPESSGATLAEAAPVTEFSPTRWYGTAQVVSTVGDVNRFYRALIDGDVLGPAIREEMLTVHGPLGEDEGYGLGLRRWSLSCGVQVWGHTGNIPGYRNWTVHHAGRHFTLFQARFTEDPDPPAERMIETAMCSPPERAQPPYAAGGAEP